MGSRLNKHIHQTVAEVCATVTCLGCKVSVEKQVNGKWRRKCFFFCAMDVSASEELTCVFQVNT